MKLESITLEILMAPCERRDERFDNFLMFPP